MFFFFFAKNPSKLIGTLNSNRIVIYLFFQIEIRIRTLEETF